MPIIIDANRVSDFPTKNHAPIICHSVTKGEARVVAGGQLAKELVKAGLGGLLLEWDRAGRLIRISEAEVLEKAATIACKSNDSHVLALAILGGCQLQYTDDQLLISDFKDKKIISEKGRIMKSSTKPKFAKALLKNFGA